MIRPLAQFIDLLYPPVCAGCGRIGQVWCENCAGILSQQPHAPIWRTLENGFPAAAAYAYEGVVRDAIHAFKFEGARELAELFAAPVAEAVRRSEFTMDVIVPVPLHAQRERWRGYNQAGLLADGLATHLGIPAAALISRERHTGTQVGRDLQARHEAIRGAFVVTENFTGARVLLVDDVVTTGATLSACAAVLMAAGAGQVMAACIASA